MLRHIKDLLVLCTFDTDHAKKYLGDTLLVQQGLKSWFSCFDSAALVILNDEPIYLFGEVRTSKKEVIHTMILPLAK